MMLNQIFYSDQELTKHRSTVLQNAEGGDLKIHIDLNNEHYGNSFIDYLLFTHYPDLVNPDVTSPKVLYNRYYFFGKFIRLYQAEHGRDVGLDQQAFQILETATIVFDWSVIEAIDTHLANEFD